MFPTLSHLTEYLFGLKFPLPIQTYSLFIVLTFLGAYFVFRSEFKRKERDGLMPLVPLGGKYVHPYELCDNILLIAVFFGFLGSKLFSIFEYFNAFIDDPMSQLASPSGLTFYGGFLLVCAAHFYYCTKKGIKAIHLADASCLGTLAGYGIGRLGCHLSGDGDWGITNLNPKPNVLTWLPDWAWSYTFPHNAYKQGEPIKGCVGEYCTELTSGVYPTSLYEFIFCGLLFLVLWSIRKKIKTPGLLAISYLVGSAVGRFLIEMIRINPRKEMLGIYLSQAQLIALAIIVFCAVWLMLIWRKGFANKGLR